MGNQKRIISLIGTSCVGKSTLMETIGQTNPDTVMILPQTTTRLPRTDDNDTCFSYVSEIEPEAMFLYNREKTYGISNDAIEKFLLSTCSIGIMINGTDEIEMLESKAPEVLNTAFINILLTYSSNVDDEKKSIRTFYSYLL